MSRSSAWGSGYPQISISVIVGVDFGIIHVSSTNKEKAMYDPDFYDFDYDDGILDGTGYDSEEGCYYYDGFPCPEASDMEEAEMIYWNTH